MENRYFNKALSDFTLDVASGGAIRHLTDLGYTVDEIKNKLDYPTPYKVVQNIVWKHLIDKGVISLEMPDSSGFKEKVTFVKDYDEFGKSSFRRVIEYEKVEAKEYVACDFGKRIYKDKVAFENELSCLSEKDKEYILGLPWPLVTVYHVLDERMKRIKALIKQMENF